MELSVVKICHNIHKTECHSWSYIMYSNSIKTKAISKYNMHKTAHQKHWTNLHRCLALWIKWPNLIWLILLQVSVTDLPAVTLQLLTQNIFCRIQTCYHKTYKQYIIQFKLKQTIFKTKMLVNWLKYVTEQFAITLWWHITNAY